MSQEAKQRERGRGRERETYGHAHNARPVMRDVEVLVCKRLGAVDACSAWTVAVDEISSLDHKVFDLWSSLVWAPMGDIDINAPRDETCSLYNPADDRGHPLTLPCRTDGSSQRYGVWCWRIVPSWLVPAVLLHGDGLARVFNMAQERRCLPPSVRSKKTTGFCMFTVLLFVDVRWCCLWFEDEIQFI